MRSKRFIGLGPALEEYLALRPGEPEFTALQEIVSVNEAAMSLIPFKGTERRALAQLERVLRAIPIEMRDSEICGVITELRSRIQSRLKKVKRFLLWQFILAFIIGTALGVAIGPIPEGISGGIIVMLVIFSPLIVITIIGYLIERFTAL